MRLTAAGRFREKVAAVEGARMIPVRASHVGLLLSRKVAVLLSTHSRPA